MKKQRLDEVLIQQGFAADKKAAFIVVTEGRVFFDGQKAVSPAQMIDIDAKLDVREERRYVGRGAYKMKAAIEEFHIPVEGAVVADIGSATGGFVEVLLEHGAARVYAIDTAKGKLDPKIREHPQVVVMEETNALHLASLPEPIDLVTIDVSFTSLRLILPAIKKFLKTGGRVAALFKPQYEVEKSELKHGIVKDDAAREREFNEFIAWTEQNGWNVLGTTVSPIRGSEGNVEYLTYLSLAAS